MVLGLISVLYVHDIQSKNPPADIIYEDNGGTKGRMWRVWDPVEGRVLWENGAPQQPWLSGSLPFGRPGPFVTRGKDGPLFLLLPSKLQTEDF